MDALPGRTEGVRQTPCGIGVEAVPRGCAQRRSEPVQARRQSNAEQPVGLTRQPVESATAAAERSAARQRPAAQPEMRLSLRAFSASVAQPAADRFHGLGPHGPTERREGVLQDPGPVCTRDFHRHLEAVLDLCALGVRGPYGHHGLAGAPGKDRQQVVCNRHRRDFLRCRDHEELEHVAVGVAEVRRKVVCSRLAPEHEGLRRDGGHELGLPVAEDARH